MQDKYLRESRKLDALSQALCSITALFGQSRDKEAAVAALVLSKLVLQQLEVLECALDELAEEAQHERRAV